MSKQVVTIDATTGGYLISRYLGYFTFTKYDPKLFYRSLGKKRGKERYQKTLYSKNFYKIQWRNIRNDVAAFFHNPVRYAPAMAYSVASIAALLFTDHTMARHIAFDLPFMGAVAIDTQAGANGGDGTNFNQTSISTTHTAAGSNRTATITGWALVNGNHDLTSPTATYDSISATQKTQYLNSYNYGDGGSTYIFGLAAPTTTSNASVAFNWTTFSAKRTSINVMTFNGTAGTFGTEQHTTTAITLSMTAGANDLTIDSTRQYSTPFISTGTTESFKYQVSTPTEVNHIQSYKTGSNPTMFYNANGGGGAGMCALPITAGTQGTNYTQTLTETLSLTATMLKLPSRVLSETLALVDSLIKTAQKIFTETLALTDSIAKIKIQTKTLSDVLSLTDSMVHTIQRTLSETLALVDSFTRIMLRAFSETLSLTGSIANVVVHTLTFSETLSLKDWLFINGNLIRNIWTLASKNVANVWTQTSKNISNIWKLQDKS